MPVTTVEHSVVTPLSEVRQQRLDAQLRHLEFSALLHRKLELEALLESFLIEAQAFVPFDGLHYLAVKSHAEIDLGDIRQYSESFDLKLGDRDLGELSLSRATPFETRELREISRLAESLVYPLDNALTHHEVVLRSMTDDVTGFLNQRALFRQLPREVRLARRARVPMSLMRVSVDTLSTLGESYGAEVELKAWQVVSRALVGNLRQSDLIFRADDDTFVIVLGNTDIEGAEALGERLRSQVHCCLSFDNIQVVLTVSIGAAELDESDCAETLQERSTRALIEAGLSGRNQIRVQPSPTPVGVGGPGPDDDPTAA